MEGLRKMVKSFKAPCIEQSGVSPDLIVEAHIGGNFVDDPQFKCYLMCLFKKFKTIKDGKLSTSTMKSQIQSLVEENTASRIIQLLEACDHLTVHEDLCEASFAYCKCYYEIDSSFYIFP
ncbi:B2 protein-like isoform X2 [Leptopilina heterotoma]|nr:B2 protein-like isoform X2 [Leptopilina heterotoma]